MADPQSKPKQQQPFNPDKYLQRFDAETYLQKYNQEPDATSAQYVTPERQEPKTLGEVALDVATPFLYATPGFARTRTPQQAAQDVGTALEVGLPLLSAPLTPGMRSIAGGALQGTGTALKNALMAVSMGRKYPLDQMARDFGTSAGIGTALGGATEIGMGGLQKGLAPFAKTFDAGSEALAKRYGLSMPASSFNTNAGVPLVETLASKGFFAQNLNKTMADSEARLVRVADELLSKSSPKNALGAPASSAELGSIIGKGFKDVESAFRTEKDRLYDLAKIQPKTVPVEPTNTLNTLDSIIGELEQVKGKRPAVLDQLQALRDGLSPSNALVKKMQQNGYPPNVIQAAIKQNKVPTEPLFAEDVLATLRDINRKIDFKNPNPITQGYEGQFKRVAASLSDDLDGSIKSTNPQLGQAIDEANRFYADGVARLNSKWGQTVNRFIKEGKESAIAKTLLNRNTPVEQIPKIFETVGQDGSQALKTATLESIIEGAKDRAGGRFTKTGMLSQLNQFGDERLSAIFGQDQIQTLKDIGHLTNILNAGENITKGSQSTFLYRMLSTLGMLTTNPLKAIRLMAGDAALSNFVTSPAGQRWLREGTQIPSAITPAVATGARMGGLVTNNYFNQ